jgi:hypothetical protein
MSGWEYLKIAVQSLAAGIAITAVLVVIYLRLHHVG